MAKHLFNFDFFKDDKIEDAYELLKYTLLLDCKDIDDITYNRKLKYDFLIHYGLLFEEEENVKEYEIDRKKFEEYSPEYKLMAIEYMSLEFMQDYIEGIGKELSEFDYVNYNIVKSYLDVYTKKMLAIYKRLDLSKGKLIKNIETYLNLNEENDLYITDETIEKIREEEETDEDASEEIIEDRIKEQLQYEQKKSREKHIRNCNSRIQKLKINEKINDLTLKQQMVEKSYSNIYLYILEKHSNYVHYDTENYKFEKCIKFIKNIDAANLELFDLYYIDKLCNISFQFEMLKFIYENKLNEIESNDLYNTFSSLKELPIFDKEILGMLLKQYKKLTSLNEKKQFEVKIRKLVYYILYYIIPLYNMIFPNVMKNIFKVKEFSGDSWEGLASWKYGRFDIRAKLPVEQGMWPAIWMMPQDSKYGWPNDGEIDIMEALGSEKNKIYGTLHSGNNTDGGQSTGVTYTLSSGDLSDDYHTYSIIWEPEKIHFLIDNKEYGVVDKWPSYFKVNDTQYSLDFPDPFNKPFYLMLNLGVGGDWGGEPNNTTKWGENTKMYVDYVRVYQKSK